MGAPEHRNTSSVSHQPMNYSEVGKAMLVTGLVLLVSAAVLLFSAEAKLQKSNAAVARTTAALLRIDEIEALVIGVDYSARGYALTGHSLFLNHEHQKQARLKQAIAELAASTEPAQAAAIANLAALAQKHAAVYADLVSKGPSQIQAVARVITDPVERQKRYDVIDVLSTMRAEHLEALSVQQRDSARQLHHTSILTFIIVVVAFLGGMTDVMARIWRDRQRRQARAAHHAA